MPTRRTVLGLAGAIGATSIIGGPGIAAADPTPIAASGAWCWFGHPRALHRAGRTYIGYLTDTGEIVVAQYDHETTELTKVVLAEGFQIDDHNNPAIHVLPDGRLEVYWTAHAVPSVPLLYRRSLAPGDVNGGWEPARQVTTNTQGTKGWTYTSLAQLSAEQGKQYLFWRGADFNPAFTTTTGDDRWTDAASLIFVDGERPYVKMCTDGRDTIHFAFTDGHPRNVHTSIFYMYYRAGSLFRADGTRIGPLGTPVSPEQADKVYDANASGQKAWIWEIATNRSGHPVLVYANFPSDTDHQYRYARWDGKRWHDNWITAAGDSISADGKEPNYSGGISLDHTDPSTVLLSKQDPGGRHEVQRWRTPDGGRTWHWKAITAGSTELNVRPFKPVGLRGNGPMSTLWMAGEYPSYVKFQTRIMALGPNGRPFAL